MEGRHGVRSGQRVRDLDGTDLGRVTGFHDWGFVVRRGMFLFRRDFVARYDEVRAVRDGVVVLARSSRDLMELARGEIPTSWRVPAPPGFPSAATPAEARLLFEDLASGAIAAGLGDVPREPPREEVELEEGEERRYADSRGQSLARPPQLS